MAWDHPTLRAALDRLMGTPGPFAGHHLDYLDGILVLSDDLVAVLRDLVDWITEEVPEVMP